MQQFLYEEYNILSSRIDKTIPSFIIENLNQNFELREYQIEAFARFFDYLHNYQNKSYPIHLLFNMATGSGKTLIMAGLILYLYEQGYRNFLFFVNSTNIIEKTKDNFLNNISNKYLFNQKIVFNNKPVNIKQVTNFDGVSDQDINICFTTIQKMHGDLHNEKENSLTFEDFKEKKIVLLSDEAHHSQVQTRQKGIEGIEKPNWENTVEKIFKQNTANLFLEFTATMDFMNKDIVDKYLNKVIYRYDLKEFRNDGFSKDVELLHTDTDKKERIIQAIILSQYRQEVSAKYGINLKPVILFKAQKTIDQSKENKELFHQIIDKLSVKDIQKIKNNTKVDILQKAFQFFVDNKITDSILVKKLQDGFAPNKCLSVNEEKEKEEYQLLLNSLEDKNNQIRAIFAVQKLNEGWDVLNLFDIVRMYETRDGKANKPGKTTISEAQLIGRGARYFPFALDKTQDKYKRKYDKDLENELRILEELHYHSYYESRYISEIKTALIEEGMLDENEQEVDLQLKLDFKKTDFYKTGLVYANKKEKRSYDNVKEIKDLGVTRKNIAYNILSGAGKQTAVFDNKEEKVKDVQKTQKEVKVKEIEEHIMENALAKNDFYDFDNLQEKFPRLESKKDFIRDNKYLAGLSITFIGSKDDLNNLSNENKFQAVLQLLNQIEAEIKANLTEYQGSHEFVPAEIKKVFEDKKIKIKYGDERLNGQTQFLEDKYWYAFQANFGTSEEKSFVEFINTVIKDLEKNYKEVYLLRNERQLKIYNFKDGQAFEPDYLLFLLDKKGNKLNYQLFIEPKGSHLIEHDEWKQEFLQEITEKYKNRVFEYNKSKKYRILGLPFYNKDKENEFKEDLFKAIN
jgi:type III restriction enzyme